MRIVNLTPHPLNFKLESGERTVQPSGTLARCVENAAKAEPLDGIPVVKKTFGVVEGLPEPEAGTSYVVSALAAQAAWAQGRTDVFCPGDPVRDTDGKIIGCRGLCARP
jgi:hypothetical protein